VRRRTHELPPGEHREEPALPEIGSTFVSLIDQTDTNICEGFFPSKFAMGPTDMLLLLLNMTDLPVNVFKSKWTSAVAYEFDPSSASSHLFTHISNFSALTFQSKSALSTFIISLTKNSTVASVRFANQATHSDTSFQRSLASSNQGDAPPLPRYAFASYTETTSSRSAIEVPPFESRVDGMSAGMEVGQPPTDETIVFWKIRVALGMFRCCPRGTLVRQFAVDRFA
jgi:hypothetical protein